MATATATATASAGNRYGNRYDNRIRYISGYSTVVDNNRFASSLGGDTSEISLH